MVGGDVSILAAIKGELPFLRAEAEALMLDAGTAKRPNGGWVVVDGKEVEAIDDLFDSICKIQSRSLAVQNDEVGGRTATTVRLELHLPASTAPLTVGDLFELTRLHAMSTADLNARYRVLGPVGKTWATARRYEVEEVVS